MAQTRIKECNECREVLPFSQFYVNRTGRDGLQSKCKSCMREKYYVPNKARMLLEKERSGSIRIIGKPCATCGGIERYWCGSCVACAIAGGLARTSRNREKALASNRRYHALNPEKIRAAHRRRNLPKPSRPEPAVCEMCGSPPGKKALNLDHCHRRNVFRGWLCWNCNVALGKFGDSIDGAIRRLMKYREVADVAD